MLFLQWDSRKHCAGRAQKMERVVASTPAELRPRLRSKRNSQGRTQ